MRPPLVRWNCAAAFVAAWLCCLSPAPLLRAQIMDDSIVSQHVRLRIPIDRSWLGRDSIFELERCWDFVRRATKGSLPRRVLVLIDMNDAASTFDAKRSSISIGMNHPAAASDLKGYLLHNAARELARMALLTLSEGGVSREENRFLVEGMAELLAREFSGTTKRLATAWAVCYYLDRMTPLGLKELANRPEVFSGHDLRAAAPGIAFLTFCRELYGRDRILKLFESLAQRSLQDSLTAAFQQPAASLQAEWLKQVRSYIPGDVTVAGEDRAPGLDRVSFLPEQAKAGAPLAMRVFTRDGDRDLLANGIFVVDETNGRVLQGLPAKTAEGNCVLFTIPIEAEHAAGQCGVRIIAIDEGGNLRGWDAHYAVVRQFLN
jgi:hypothetical protein